MIWRNDAPSDPHIVEARGSSRPDTAFMPMIRQSWRTRLKAAAGEEDALAVVRGFLAEWSQDEIAELPRGAWPVRISDRADVLSHAALLAGLHARFEGGPESLGGLQEMLLFFTHAAVRMAKIAAAPEAADPPRRGRAVAARKRTSNGRRARG